MYGNSFPIRNSFIWHRIFIDKHSFKSLSSKLCRQCYAAFRPLPTAVSREGRGLPARLTLWVLLVARGPRPPPALHITTCTPERGKWHIHQQRGCCWSPGDPQSQGRPAAAPSSGADRSAATFSFMLILIKQQASHT